MNKEQREYFILRALMPPCRDIHAVRVMTSIVNHVLKNYEQLEVEGRCM